MFNSFEWHSPSKTPARTDSESSDAKWHLSLNYISIIEVFKYSSFKRDFNLK